MNMSYDTRCCDPTNARACSCRAEMLNDAVADEKRCTYDDELRNV